MIATSPDVILVNGITGLEALMLESRTIPIVFVNISEPGIKRWVASFSHPGGNITGFALSEQQIFEKYLQLLKEVAPHITRVLYLNAPRTTQWGAQALMKAAPSYGLEFVMAIVRTVTEIQSEIESFASQSNGSMLVMPTTLVAHNRDLVIGLAMKYRLPSIYAYRFFTSSGGLMSYGADVVEMHRLAASYVDRILRGAKPNELPVQLPTKFELAINLKTAKELGLTIPTTLLARADEVIE